MPVDPDLNVEMFVILPGRPIVSYLTYCEEPL